MEDSTSRQPRVTGFESVRTAAAREVSGLPYTKPSLTAFGDLRTTTQGTSGGFGESGNVGTHYTPVS